MFGCAVGVYACKHVKMDKLYSVPVNKSAVTVVTKTVGLNRSVGMEMLV